MNEKIIEELKTVPSGSVAVCKRQGTSYYRLYAYVMEETKNFPEWANFAYRKQHVENGMTEPSKCGCGCGETLRNHKKRFLSGHGNRSAEVKARKVSSYMERTGYENPSQNPDVKASKETTCVEHYGAKHHMQSERGYSEYKAKMVERMGVENPFQLESVKDKIHQKIWPKRHEVYAKRSLMKSQNFYDRMKIELADKFEPLFSKDEYHGSEHDYSLKCIRCGRIVNVKVLTLALPPRCLVCDPVPIETGSSEIEIELRSFVTSLGVAAKFNDRTQIQPLELDVYLPEHSLAIELNGLYWHTKISGGKDDNYHLNKLKRCTEKGIRLIQIFEDEWRYSKNIVKARIRNALGMQRFSVGARECQIVQVDKETKNKFLDKYHMQGRDKSVTMYGLHYRGRLIAVMTFSGLRKIMGRNRMVNQYELMRFATLSNVTVNGGAGRLLVEFIRKNNPDRIFTYADKRWSEGNLYKKLGFTQLEDSKPGYWYTDDYKTRYHRAGFMKARLVKQGGDPNKTEIDIMIDRGYDLVYDCGNMVFEWTPKQ